MSTDDILDELIAKQERVSALQEELSTLLPERDAAVVLARQTGTGGTELARLTGLSRGRVNQILTRAGLHE